MHKSKKAFSGMWENIVYAVLVVILILAIWFIFKGGATKGSKNLIDIGDSATDYATGEKCKAGFLFSENYCEKSDVECKDDSYRNGGTFKDCKEDQKCCIKIG